MTPEHNLIPKAMSLTVHELRTPVTVVAGYLRMLLREQGGPLTEKQRKMLEEAERSCGRLSALVAEISEFGKLEGGELAFRRQELDLGTLLAELASGMHEGEDRGVRLELRLADSPAGSTTLFSNSSYPITGDRPRLTAALHALLRSALRERGEPGTVVVACGIQRAVAGEAGGDDAKWAVVAIGADADIAPLVAQATAVRPPPFEEWHGGLGLALPVARRVIEAHGGALWSAVGSHSRAASALRLPLRM